MIDVVRSVAEQIFIPFSVGGGLRTIEDCFNVLQAGAEKINLNSAAIKNPELIREAANAFGNQAVVLSMDVLKVPTTSTIPNGYEIIINGGRTPTGLDAIEWAKKGEQLGAGEMVVNSIDADGTKNGYEINLTSKIVEAVQVPVIASGGGGTPEHMYQVLTEGKADAAIVASMLHYGEYTVPQIKQYLAAKGLKIRI
jgi:cyclase